MRLFETNTDFLCFELIYEDITAYPEAKTKRNLLSIWSLVSSSMKAVG